MNIRTTTETEREIILEIHKKSFGEEKGRVIAQLVDDLLDDDTAEPTLSLVAEMEDEIIGHILFTKAIIEQADADITAQILAPLAVIPSGQGKGAGQKLINEGLRLLKEGGTELVFVLGHPGYYPRCGFIPAGKEGYSAPYPIPEEHADAWMVQELNGDSLSRYNGNVRCSKVLNEPQHWRE